MYSLLVQSNKLVVVRSAYANAGDHLISEAVSAQLGRFGVAHEILRRPRVWDSESKKLFQEKVSTASAICLAGGPLVREDLFEVFLANTLRNQLQKCFFYGVGRSGGVNRLGRVDFGQPERIMFSRLTENSLREVMSNGLAHSVRDSVTKNVLQPMVSRRSTLTNTGCPVLLESSWPKKQNSALSRPAPSVLLTAPAREHRSALDLTRWLAREPRIASIRLLFQSGLDVPDANNFTLRNRLIRSPRLLGVRNFNNALIRELSTSRAESGDQAVLDVQGDQAALRSAIDEADVVVGYRVHAHLYALSQGKKSFLISEDIRGLSQVADLWGVDLGRGYDLQSKIPTTSTSLGVILKSLSDFLFSDSSDDNPRAQIALKKTHHENFLTHGLKGNLAKLGL